MYHLQECDGPGHEAIVGSFEDWKEGGEEARVDDEGNGTSGTQLRGAGILFRGIRGRFA